MPQSATYDVAIIGAGPGGSSAAIGLRGSGLRTLLIDKGHFPKHKVCGDAIPNNAMRMLNRVAPELEQSLRQTVTHRIEGYAAYWKGRKVAAGSWPMQAVNANRRDFDNALFEQAIQNPLVTHLCGQRVQHLQQLDNGDWSLNMVSGDRFESRYLVLAHGANGDFRQALQLPKMDKSQWGVAGSQYRTGWSKPIDRNVFFIPKKSRLPGYFWIFPTGPQTCNVGFGVISQEPVKLKELYQQVCQEDPCIAEWLAGTTAETEFQGHQIPIPSKPIRCASRRAFLVGDAAELVDPLYGHGIDKAIISGTWAAEAIVRDSKGLAHAEQWYQSQLETRLWPEMHKSYRRMKMLSWVMKHLPF
ncbi:MAG: geranylgeranyl reductase family protein [Bacteroidia bacterium]